jgi:hypothetical protein
MLIRTFTFSDVKKADRVFERKYPGYKDALRTYQPTASEIEKRQICPDGVNVTVPKVYEINGKYIETESSKSKGSVIHWMDLIDSVRKKMYVYVDCSTPGKMLYVLWLMSLDDKPSRQEIENIFLDSD